MVRRRILLIVAVIIAGTAFSVWWTLGQPRVYEATAVAQIESPTVTEPTSVITPGGGGNNIEQRLRLLEQQLMARDNIVAMVERYDLYADTGFTLNRKVAQLRESTRIVHITDPNASFGVPRVPTGMMITVSDTSAMTSADLANDFLNQLVTLNRERRSLAAEENLAFFRAEAERVQVAMAALETQIAEFKESNAPYLPAGVAAQRDELQTLKSTLLEIEQKLIELEATRTRQRAEVIERQSRLLREQQALIQKRIDEINAAIAAAPEVDRQFGVMSRELEQLQEQYTVITRRATEAEMGQILTAQDQFERVEVLETALVPENPVSGSRKKQVALGAFLSGVAGLGLALLLEMMNPVIRTPAQLERTLGLEALVSIPRIKNEESRRRKRMIWLTIIAALAAAAWAWWGFFREFGTNLLGFLTRAVDNV